MNFKLAADGEVRSSELEVGSGLFGMTSRKPVELPEGTLHAYLPGATETFCGVATATLALFPNIDWPGGVELTDRHCPRCGEATADV